MFGWLGTGEASALDCGGGKVGDTAGVSLPTHVNGVRRAFQRERTSISFQMFFACERKILSRKSEFLLRVVTDFASCDCFLHVRVMRVSL